MVNSLISWAHAGSHADIDDIDYMTDNLEAQCRLFKRIFEKTGNIDHYNMMMGEDVSNELAD